MAHHPRRSAGGSATRSSTSTGTWPSTCPTLAPYLEQEGLSLDHPSFRRLVPPYGGTDAQLARTDPGRAGGHPHPPGPVVERSGRPDHRPGHRPVPRAALRAPRRASASTSGWSIRASGLVFLHTDDEQYRRGTCRALNRANAETFAPLADRLTPVAAIPMHTPEEAVAELEYAVTVLGFKAVLCAGYVQRPFDALAGEDPERVPVRLLARPVRDRLGLRLRPGVGPGPGARGVHRLPLRLHRDDPVPLAHRATCSTTCPCWPRASSRWPSRSSSAASPAASPDMNFAFLEGGVAWAAALYSDIVGHWEKRNLAGAPGPPRPRPRRPRR